MGLNQSSFDLPHTALGCSPKWVEYQNIFKYYLSPENTTLIGEHFFSVALRNLA